MILSFQKIGLMVTHKNKEVNLTLIVVSVMRKKKCVHIELLIGKW